MEQISSIFNFFAKQASQAYRSYNTQPKPLNDSQKQAIHNIIIFLKTAGVSYNNMKSFLQGGLLEDCFNNQPDLKSKTGRKVCYEIMVAKHAEGEETILEKVNSFTYRGTQLKKEFVNEVCNIYKVNEIIDILNIEDSLLGLFSNQTPNVKNLINKPIGVNFSGTLLTKTDFSGIDLPYADFSKSILTLVDFSETNLSNAIFLDSEIVAVDFSNANLQKVDFSKAIFVMVNGTLTAFHNTNLYDVKLPECLKNTIFSIKALRSYYKSTPEYQSCLALYLLISIKESNFNALHAELRLHIISNIVSILTNFEKDIIQDFKKRGATIVDDKPIAKYNLQSLMP